MGGCCFILSRFMSPIRAARVIKSKRRAICVRREIITYASLMIMYKFHQYENFKRNESDILFRDIQIDLMFIGLR